MVRNKEMHQFKRRIFLNLSLLLITCALNSLTEASNTEVRDSDRDGKKLFDLIENEHDETYNRNPRSFWNPWRQQPVLENPQSKLIGDTVGFLQQERNYNDKIYSDSSAFRPRQAQQDFQRPSYTSAWKPLSDQNLYNGHGHYSRGQNENAKLKPSIGPNEFNTQSYNKDDYWYEGISSDSNKPRKENKKSKESPNKNDHVAIFDPIVGIRCPSIDSTGQYVYPLDCKFYVNCWYGRAFVQACAPGTLFSPETLECDFPNKVQCNAGRLNDFDSTDYGGSDDGGAFIIPGTLRADNKNLDVEPKCPLYVNGLMPHPSDCMKFLHCDNGNSFVMECGPNTVFNPLLNICDFPENVEGCRDSTKNSPENDEIIITPKPSGSAIEFAESIRNPKILNLNERTKNKNPKCPRDFSGILAHPDTCSKFLQCANGNTFVMDCGPGTVFNPIALVCDWPANVPGCKDNSDNKRMSNLQPNSFAYPDNQWKPMLIQDHRQQPPADSQFGESSPYHNIQSYPLNIIDRRFNVNDKANSETPLNSNPINNPNKKQNALPDVGPPQTFHRPANYLSNHNTKEAKDNNHQVRLPASQINMNNQSIPDNDRRPYGRIVNKPPYQSQSPKWTTTSSTTKAPVRPNTWRGFANKANQVTTTTVKPAPSPQNVYPFGIFVIVNGTRDHYIAQDPKIDQGHSKLRQQNSNTDALGNTTPANKLNDPRPQKTKENIPNRYLLTTPAPKPISSTGFTFPTVLNITLLTSPINQKPNIKKPEPAKTKPDKNSHQKPETIQKLPNSTIEDYYDENISLPDPEAWSSNKESPIEDYYDAEDLEYDDDSNVWVPSALIKNKTVNDKKPSTVMKIGNSREPSILDFELTPEINEERPFPAYYIPPVRSINDPEKPDPVTPISHQVIRLRGGSGPDNGYLEVQGIQPGWGTVCDSKNGWNIREGNLVCRQLGYNRGAEKVWQGRPKSKQIPSWIAASNVVCHGNETKFQNCKFTHKSQCTIERDAIGVKCFPNRLVHCRKDETPHQGQCYHYAEPSQALNHAEAIEYCHRRNSRLVDVAHQEENNFLSEFLFHKYPHVNSVMTSGVGFSTMNRTLWIWEDSSATRFKYSNWWPGWSSERKGPPYVGSRPVCITMKRMFPCHERPDSDCRTDYFFWESEDCAVSFKGHSFVCERPYDDIGCLYGNGHQYAGNANITSSGKDCLSWADAAVIHKLRVNVPIKEVREKLMAHNFCRNPNPEKDSKPWCFASASGEKEFCDIPSCGKLISKKSIITSKCKPKHFECLPGECIPSPWVCDGEKDCTNGADERKCTSHVGSFKKYPKSRLNGFETEKWLNTPVKTCAMRCKEADFTCRSFTHKRQGNICYLSDSNIGMTGALVPSEEEDYYEMKERSIDCENMFVCGSQKCINHTNVCDGKNDCLDRTDEKICSVENLDYAIRLAGTNSTSEGRVEVKILGKWGQVCDDGFDMIDANVVCKEIGFDHGALEIKSGGFYGNMEPPTSFMVDQLKCRGNESTIRECDFEGWGVHNCQPQEAVGVVCKVNGNTCQEGHWKCDTGPGCIPTPFICDEVVDCPDGSDESPEHCDAPFEVRLVNGSDRMRGRVEVRHHGIWGTICDDDFTNMNARVICRSLGYVGPAIAKKGAYFGYGTGPIWLDEVYCNGNETQINKCEHSHWGRHNCDHSEDAGVICSLGDGSENFEVIRTRM